MTRTNLFIFVAAALLAVVFSHPAYRKEFDKIVNSNDCLKSCISNLTSFNEETSLMKNPNIEYYFGKIDDICEIISSTRECIDKCGIESNPFALDSVTVICSDEMREKVEKLGECLHSKTNIYKTCSDSCGDYDAANDQVHQLTQSLKETEVRDNGKVNPIMEKTDEACGIFKCVTKCSVETVRAECGKEDAEELQAILQKVFDTHHADLKKLNIVEQMSKTIPPQCNYMWDPTVIFSSNTEMSQRNPNTAEILAKVQLELLVKQLKLIERQDDLITRENQKLDMEMDLLSQKFYKKHHQQPKSFEESQIMFS